MVNIIHNKKDIGGDLILDSPVLLNKKENNLNIYNKNFNYYLNSGRSAIYLSLMIIKSKIKNFKAFLPYYSCPSILQPFKELNIEIIFYGMGSDLSTPFNLPKNIDNSVFFFIHYFGFKNLNIIKFLNRHKKNSNNFYIIEDLVQTCLSTHYRNSIGDFKISSFRKFLPVPDGALLSTNYKSNLKFLIPDFEYIAYQITSKELRRSSLFEDLYLDLYSRAENILDKKTNLNEISFFSKNIIKKINLNYIKKKRYLNWMRLNLFFMDRDKKFERIYKKINKYDVPLSYPVIIKNNKRDKFLKYLNKNRVFCAIHWNLKYGKKYKLYYEEYLISKSIVSIPIDHRINNNDLTRLMGIIDEF